MSKSKEELNKLKEEVEAVNEKLAELTPAELEKVNGGCAGITTVTIPGGKISREAAGSVDGTIRQR